jgi:hypothetical protein
MHVRESEIAASMLERQFFMIDSKQVQDGGVQVVHVHFVVNCSMAELVGLAIGDAWLNTATG